MFTPDQAGRREQSAFDEKAHVAPASQQDISLRSSELDSGEFSYLPKDKRELAAQISADISRLTGIASLLQAEIDTGLISDISNKARIPTVQLGDDCSPGMAHRIAGGLVGTVSGGVLGGILGGCGSALANVFPAGIGMGFVGGGIAGAVYGVRRLARLSLKEALERQEFDPATVREDLVIECEARTLLPRDLSYQQVEEIVAHVLEEFGAMSGKRNDKDFSGPIADLALEYRLRASQYAKVLAGISDEDISV